MKYQWLATDIPGYHSDEVGKSVSRIMWLQVMIRAISEATLLKRNVLMPKDKASMMHSVEVAHSLKKTVRNHIRHTAYLGRSAPKFALTQ